MNKAVHLQPQWMIYAEEENFKKERRKEGREKARRKAGKQRLWGNVNAIILV